MYTIASQVDSCANAYMIWSSGIRILPFLPRMASDVSAKQDPEKTSEYEKLTIAQQG
jgi:hypothetical protein